MDALDAKHAADEERAKVMANVRRVMAPVGNIFMRGVFTLVNKAAGNASYALLHFTGRQTLSRLRQKGDVDTLLNEPIKSTDIPLLKKEFDKRFGKGASRKLVFVTESNIGEGKKIEVASGLKVSLASFAKGRAAYVGDFMRAHVGTENGLADAKGRHNDEIVANYKVLFSMADMDAMTNGHGARERAEFVEDFMFTMKKRDIMLEQGFKNEKELNEYLKEKKIRRDEFTEDRDTDFRDEEAIRTIKEQTGDRYMQFNLDHIGADISELEGKDLGNVTKEQFSKAYTTKFTSMVVSGDVFKKVVSPEMMQMTAENKEYAIAAVAHNGDVTMYFPTAHMRRLLDRFRGAARGRGMTFIPKDLHSFMGDYEKEDDLKDDFADFSAKNLHNVGRMTLDTWADYCSNNKFDDVRIHSVGVLDPVTMTVTHYTNAQKVKEDLSKKAFGGKRSLKEQEQEASRFSQLDLAETPEELARAMDDSGIDAVMNASADELDRTIRPLGNEFAGFNSLKNGSIMLTRSQFEKLVKDSSEKGLDLFSPNAEEIIRSLKDGERATVMLNLSEKERSFSRTRDESPAIYKGGE